VNSINIEQKPLITCRVWGHKHCSEHCS